MLDLFSTEQQNQQSPLAGSLAQRVDATPGEAYAATKEANDRVDSLDAEYQNQRDFFQQRIDAFTAKTGVPLPKPQDVETAPDDFTDRNWIGAVRAKMQAESQARNDPSLMPPSDQDIAAGGLSLARGAVRRQAELSSGPTTFGSIIGSTGASSVAAATDPLNIIALSAAPEGGPLLASALRMGAAMGVQTAVGDALHYSYRQKVNPDYGLSDVAGDVASSAVAGGLFGAGSALGGEGIRATLGAAAGGAVGGAALGGISGGSQGAFQGAIGGAALPLAGAAFGLSAKTLGMGWRTLRDSNPELAASMPLDVRDAGVVAEKAGDLQAQNPFKGPSGDAAYADAVSAAENSLLTGQPFEMPRSAAVEAQARRGQVFYPGGSIDARYDLAEMSDLTTSHDADFMTNPNYPADLQPRDRSGAPARDQVNAIAGDLQPDRLGPSPEANAGAPIVGPDGVVESGNGRTLAVNQAYEQGRAGAYRQWLERQGYDTTGYDRPILVGVRETPMDDAARADFAHSANGSASLRMSATEQALSDARHLDPSLVEQIKSSDLGAAANRDAVRAFVAKLPEGERGSMMQSGGTISANGVRRMQAALAARAYGDTGILARAFDHPDPNIKAIAGALTDAAAPWAQMRDAATRGDIEPGHDITGDMLQSVRAIMRARDEGRPPWEVLNQGEMFQSDTTQLATRMFFRDPEMRQPAGRSRVAEALRTYADEAQKNTVGGRLFDDSVAPTDVLRRISALAAEKIGGLLDQASKDVEAFGSVRRTSDRGASGLSQGIEQRAAELHAAGVASDPLSAAEAAHIESLPPEIAREAYGDTAQADVRDAVMAKMREGRRPAAAEDAIVLKNPRTGSEAPAQEMRPLREALAAVDVSNDKAVDILGRASHLAIGDRLGKIVGDMPVYTVGPAEMRTLAEGRMRVLPGFEPAGFYDPAAGHIVALDDALRNPEEGSRLLIHEGLHGAFMQTIEKSDAARALVDQLRTSALQTHLDRGGDAADHYGLKNAHEFVSEGFSNPEFQRFLASIPADDRVAAAFDLDDSPGHTLWDVFVAAVRKILGISPDQHTLLDATLRLGGLLEDERADMARGDGDVLPMLRPEDPVLRGNEAEERMAKARAFANAKDAISYRINSDRIAQHPNGPLAGFLGILTRDIHEKGGINVESVAEDYRNRLVAKAEPIIEAYGSKMAGLKQDVFGIRDMLREVFGVDTGNASARTAGEAWKAIDNFATTEAKRLGKVFAPAEDWRVPQFWESSRAQKFGKATLIGDMEREITSGGLKVFDPDTGEEANPLRLRAILDGAADRIVTDASMGGTHGGAFKTDMRVFRFADGAAGADSYLRLMDKYGAGQGGYLHMLEAHMGKVSRELGLARVLGPGWQDIGEKLLQDAILADKKIEAAKAPRDASQRLSDLPGDAGHLAISWLESRQKAEAVWQHMSGQASGVGSELMAGLLSGTRAFMTSTRMGSAIVTAVPADSVNWLMAAKHNGLAMGRIASEITKAFVSDNQDRREAAARLGIAAHAGMDAAIGTKRFEDQTLGEGLMKRLAGFVIRAQGLHAWDSAIARVFPMEFLGAIGERSGKAFEDLDAPFANFIDRYGLKNDWPELAKAEHLLDVGPAKYLHPDTLPENVRTKLMSAIYDERQLAYLAGGTERVRAISGQAKAGTLPGELARSIFLFKQFPMTMLATWGKRSANEAAAGRIGTLATLVTGMTMAGALAMQARSLLQGKDPRNMADPYFWGESFLQGGAAGIYGDFFKEAFSRSDTSLTETMMGPLAAIPAGIQGLTSGARRVAEDGEHVNFGAKFARLLPQNVPGANLWPIRLVGQRLLFDNVQRMIDRDYAASFARQQQRSMKTNGQGFWWAPGQNTPGP